MSGVRYLPDKRARLALYCGAVVAVAVAVAVEVGMVVGLAMVLARA